MKKRSLLFSLGVAIFFALGFLPSAVSAQNPDGCGTEITPEQLDYLMRTREERQNYVVQHRAVTNVPLQFHVVRRTDGTGGLTTSQLSTMLSTLNSYYTPADMQFFECGPVNYIDNTTWFDFNQTEESAVAGANDVTNVINIYFFNTVTSSGGSSLCGYSRFPPSVDRIIMKNSCATNGSTLTHEVGHYFSLYHTHGKTNTGTTDELVNGSNCATAGDDVCDTDADPNLSGLVTSSCVYTGSATDANGDTYTPDPNNIMSYSVKACRTVLSPGQYSRAAFSLANDRNYLSCATGSGGCSGTVTNFPWSEGFESGLGDFSNPGGDDFDWTRNSGGTPSTATGPTAASSGSWYVYMESSSPNYPSKTANLHTPCFDLTGKSGATLTFNYHMYGAAMGTLQINVSTDGGSTWSGSVWSRTGDQGNTWNSASVNLNSYAGNSSVLVRFRGTTSTSYTSDFSIDNVGMSVTVPSGASLPYSFGFESGIGGWNQVSGDDMDWTRKSGSTTSSNTGPTAASEGSWYMYTEASSPNYPSKTARFTSPALNFSGISGAQLSFDYHMWGATIGTLSIQVSTNGGSSWSGNVWSLSGDQGNSWQSTTVDLSGYAGNNSVILRFTGVTGSSFTGDISIDDVRVEESSAGYGTGFEPGFDGWTQGGGDDFDWIRRTGSTPSSGTGPTAAYEGSYYVYVEASSPNYSNKTTYLLSPELDFSGASNATMSFRYHMFGTGPGTFSIQVSTNNGSTWSGNVWSRTGSQGNAWLATSVNLSAYDGSSSVRLRLTGTTGTTWSGDIAVDDVSISGASLDVLAEPVQATAPAPQVSVYPNPARDMIHLQLEGMEQAERTVSISDMMGRVQLQSTLSGNSLDLNVSQLAAGTYFLRLQDQNAVLTRRVVIQR